MKTLSKLFILILVFLASSVLCQVDYSNEIQPIFNNNCIGCHGDYNNLYLDSYANLMAGNSTNGPVIISGDSDNSILVQKILGTADFGGRMPSGNPTYFDSNPNDLQLIKDWIDQGALLSTIYDDYLFPEKLSIIGNFPNPFNPFTHFQVYSPITQQGKVSIINFAGQKVVDLGIVHLNPGTQIFSWNHQTFVNLSSGQYLFFLKTDELIVTHRISLIK